MLRSSIQELVPDMKRIEGERDAESIRRMRPKKSKEEIDAETFVNKEVVLKETIGGATHSASRGIWSNHIPKGSVGLVMSFVSTHDKKSETKQITFYIEFAVRRIHNGRELCYTVAHTAHRDDFTLAT